MGVLCLCWAGCVSVAGNSSKSLRPVPQNDIWVHPKTKIPYSGEYDVVEEGVRLKMELKDGRPHGRWQRWYDSGRPHEEYLFVKGQRDGLQVSWYPNGQKMMEAQLRQGQMLSAQSWHSNGEKASAMSNGTGTLILFDSKGRKRSESVYQNGSRISRMDF